MPTWGIHLYIAKKVNRRLKIKDYNDFLIGNIITDINNGYVVKNISKIIQHKKTHYYSEIKMKKGSQMHYDVEQFIKDNSKNIQEAVVLGYITHLLADEYWNNVTYERHGLYNEKNELIGMKLNDKTEIVVDMNTRRKMKQSDFKIFTNYLYKNKLIDIPVYDEKVCDKIKNIKQIELTKEDIDKTINYLQNAQNNFTLDTTDYEIFTLKEMKECIDLCTEYIVDYLKVHNINL